MRVSLLFFICVLSLVLLFSSYMGSVAEAGLVFDSVSRAATDEDGVKMISYEQFSAIRMSGEEYALVDVLSPERYANGHIEGAVSLPLDEINAERVAIFMPKSVPVIVYCANVMCHASTRAAQKFAELGYTVIDYKGGLKEWEERGNELVKKI